MHPLVYIVDISWGGHIPDYHKLFIKYYVDRDYLVHSISPSPQEINSWSNLLPNNMLEVTGITIKDIKSHWRAISYAVNTILRFISKIKGDDFHYSKWINKYFETAQTWSFINHLIRKKYYQTGIKPQIVLINYIDQYFMLKGFSHLLVDLLFKYKWACVFMSPTEFRLKNSNKSSVLWSAIPQRYDILKSRNLYAILMSDEKITKENKIIANKKVIFLPEIISRDLPQNKSILAKKIQKTAKDRKIISLLGVLAERKGVELFLQIAKKLEKMDYYFLLAGSLHDGIYKNKNIVELLELPHENMFTHFKEIENEMYFNELVELSDIIFIAYKNFYHGSGILSRAVAFEKPIIGSIGYCIGERIEEFQLGLTIKQDSVEEGVESVITLCDPDYQFESKRIKYLNMHSIETFKNSMNILNRQFL